MSDEYSHLRRHCRDAMDTSEEVTSLAMQSARTRRIRYQSLIERLTEDNAVMTRIENRQYETAIRNQGNANFASGFVRGTLPENRKAS